jgi:hypothetical protein
MQKRKLSRDTDMGGVPSEIEDHSATKNMESETLFGEARSLGVSNTAIFISSPAMKPSLSLNSIKRVFEDSSEMWNRVDNAMQWDMRSPENVELEELDGMFDDL